MKRQSVGLQSSLPAAIATFKSIGNPRKSPVYLFLALCFNLGLAPLVLATSGDTVSRSQAYALGILAIVTITLSGYLFVVMFQPERF